MASMKREVVVVGGGLAGWATAIGFAHRGIDTAILAPPAPADRRSTALIGPSVEFLDALGIGPALAAIGQPMRTMRLIDDSGRLLRAPTVEFRAAEIGRASFGLNVLNADLVALLREAAARLADRLSVVEEPAAEIRGEADHIVLASAGTTIRASLAVGADGRNSLVRRHAGITLRDWRYPQSAVVLNFRHGREHDGASTEFHTRTGPFTQVPLPGRRSSLVWVEDPRVAATIPDLNAGRLSHMVEARMHSILGAVEVEDGLQTFPLGGAVAGSMVGERVALVGEAAHVFPPIGAQGLNLGLRDAADLVEAVAAHRDDVGGSAALQDYARRRRLDVGTRTATVDLLNRSLLTGFLPVQAARRLGLGALASIGPLRRAVMREGVAPGSALPASAASRTAAGDRPARR